MTLKTALTAAGLLGALATPAQAQASNSPSFAWVLPNTSFTACVEFLMEPGLAARQLTPGFQVVPANRFGGLSPVLERESADSVHALWIPAQVCFLEAPTLSAGGSIFSPDKKMGGQEVVAYWGIAAVREGASSGAAEWAAVALWTNDWRLRKQTETEFIPVTVFKRQFTPVAESNRHHYAVQIGKTVLSWDGEIVGRDSTEAQPVPSSTLIFDGSRGIRWTGLVSNQPRWSRTLPGVFGVQGKDDLAQALKASPIRLFGPMIWGGDARVDFSR